MRSTINIYEVVASVQARKERTNKVPAQASFYEIKAELQGVDDGELYAQLDAIVDSGLVRRVRTLNGSAYVIAEE